MENILPDFLIIPSHLINDEDMQPLDGYVYGIIYWYTKLKLQKCVAKSATIANLLGVKPNSIDNSIIRLAKKEYIKSTYDRSKHERELTPLITYEKSIPSKKGIASPQMMKSIPSNEGSAQPRLRTPNKKIKEEDINNTVTKRNGFLTKLPRITKDKEYIDYLVDLILEVTQDKHSRVFYEQVAAKITEQQIRQALSEIKADGANNPAALFTYKIQRLTLGQRPQL